MNETEFSQQLEAEGYGLGTVVSKEPNHSVDMHTHDFSAYLMVQSGIFTLVTESGSTNYPPGDTCKVDAGSLHAEQTGPEGATFLIGKK